MMKETEENTDKWKDIACLWIRKLTLLKCSYYPKQSTGSLQSLLKFQLHFSQIILKSDPKIHIEAQK